MIVRPVRGDDDDDSVKVRCGEHTQCVHEYKFASYRETTGECMHAQCRAARKWFCWSNNQTNNLRSAENPPYSAQYFKNGHLQTHPLRFLCSFHTQNTLTFILIKCFVHTHNRAAWRKWKSHMIMMHNGNSHGKWQRQLYKCIHLYFIYRNNGKIFGPLQASITNALMGPYTFQFTYACTQFFSSLLVFFSFIFHPFHEHTILYSCVNVHLWVCTYNLPLTLSQWIHRMNNSSLLARSLARVCFVFFNGGKQNIEIKFN